VRADQGADVVINTADLFRVHLVVASDPAEVFPNSGFDLGTDPIYSVLVLKIRFRKIWV
jgi:hypothetical protein